MFFTVHPSIGLGRIGIASGKIGTLCTQLDLPRRIRAIRLNVNVSLEDIRGTYGCLRRRVNVHDFSRMGHITGTT